MMILFPLEQTEGNLQIAQIGARYKLDLTHREDRRLRVIHFISLKTVTLMCQYSMLARRYEPVTTGPRTPIRSVILLLPEL